MSKRPNLPKFKFPNSKSIDMKKTVIPFFMLLLPLLALTQSATIMMDSRAEEALPLDGVVERKVRTEKRVLDYPPIRENDLLWEKRVWQLIDTREKANLTFRYPKKYFFDILTDGIKQGAIKAYSPESDGFTFPLNQQEALKDLVRVDTIPIVDPYTLEESIQIVENVLDPETIIRYRIKEDWYFDKTYGALRVRILGIAPMITEKDDFGNIKYERPLFWVYYPDCREWLSRFTYYNDKTDAGPMSWEDLFEMRHFASYIVKESNVHDERLEDYLSGIDRLMESDRIRQKIFNYEHDLWSY